MPRTLHKHYHTLVHVHVSVCEDVCVYVCVRARVLKNYKDKNIINKMPLLVVKHIPQIKFSPRTFADDTVIKDNFARFLFSRNTSYCADYFTHNISRRIYS